MDTQKAQELLNKYKLGTLNPEEEAILDGWHLKMTANERVEISGERLIQQHDHIWRNLPVNRQRSLLIKRNKLIFFTAAATVLIALSAGLFFYSHKKASSYSNMQSLGKNDIAPGKNKAILTLADQSTVSLTDAVNGIVASQQGVSISKTADGQLEYKGSGEASSALNTITTPKGGQFQISLPDGTKVWLNAASSLRFPVTFTNSKERKVELKGEAYFEVAKNKAMPFRVVSPGQIVEVLGTHFNINSYADEPVIKTTLLEGSVAIHHQQATKVTLLKPGQQAALTANQIKVSDADIMTAVDWKNGEFLFRDDDFHAVMRKIARWYDVEVVYDTSAPRDFELGGVVSRTKNISAVLTLIELTGKVHFKVEGRRVTVIK